MPAIAVVCRSSLFHHHTMISPKFQKWLFLLSFWMLLAITVWLQIKQDLPLWPSITITALTIAGSIVCAHILSDLMLAHALRKRNLKRFYSYAFFMLLLLTVYLGLLNTLYLLKYRPDMINGDTDFLSVFWVRFYISIPSSLLINGTLCGMRFYQEHVRIEKKHAQLQQAHLEGQVRFLQSQINPHVMFNVLNHIFILMKKDVEIASFLLLKFSDVLRYQLYECNRNQVKLSREIQYLQDLVAVEQLRWGNELDVSCNWDIEDNETPIAPLLLVPFVENAFKHVSRLEGHKGYIKIHCSAQGGFLRFYIENPYTMLSGKRQMNAHGIGLQNVQNRLQLQYPNAHELIIDPSDHVFKVTLVLDLGKIII